MLPLKPTKIWRRENHDSKGDSHGSFPWETAWENAGTTWEHQGKILELHGKTIGKPLDISMGIWELMVILKVFHEEMGFFVGDISLEFFSRWDFNKKNIYIYIYI